MKASVRAAFWTFSEPLEGYVPTFYRDVLDLVTIGVGNLVDPIHIALTLPMRRADGSPATRAEIEAEWHRIKSAPDLGKLGWRAAARIATLHLTREDVERLVLAKLDENEVHLHRRFPGWDDMPADAQLALCSWAWAVGPHSAYPRMVAACNREDYDAAALECTITPPHGTIPKRNARNRHLFANAANVVRYDLDREFLYWPSLALVPPDVDPAA